MAYDSGPENIALLKRTLMGTVDFKGRSRRTEVVYYWIATALLNLIIGFPISLALPWDASLIVNKIITALFMLPFFALFARRLHDQDRTGWWALILPVIIGLNVFKFIRFISLEPDQLLTTPSPIASYELWIGFPLAIAYLVLTFIPGTAGENKFGPDPRIG